VWPGLPAPDPWLAPRIRAELGLPGLEARIGLSAHDFAGGLGAPSVLLTRARRDATAPTIASRFWLRLEALAGEGWARAAALADLARALDHGGVPAPAPRPRPRPPAAVRPRRISVTELDRLKADPYDFYAKRILGLRALDAVDADPSPAWRGTQVHAILERWAVDDALDPARLRPRAEAMLAEIHPLMRALWAPRLLASVDWLADHSATLAAAGRTMLAAEQEGEIAIAGVELRGKFDRLDRLPGGELAVIDYKTGGAPKLAAVRAGFSLQLGLLGLIAERGGYPGVSGTAGAFEYWSLAKGPKGFGSVTTPVDPAGARDRIVTADFVPLARDHFAAAAARWLTGDDPFTAKLHPEYVPYGDYDQLMRQDEWYGRE
jgi:ATP-dependent helicase/nuclease subunit B